MKRLLAWMVRQRFALGLILVGVAVRAFCYVGVTGVDDMRYVRDIADLIAGKGVICCSVIRPGMLVLAGPMIASMGAVMEYVSLAWMIYWVAGAFGIWFLALRVWNSERAALLVLLFHVLNPIDIPWSSVVFPDSPCGTLLILSLLMLRTIRVEAWLWRSLLAGFFFALGVGLKENALLFGAVLLSGVFCWMPREVRLKSCLAMAAIYGIFTLSARAYYFYIFGDWMAREHFFVDALAVMDSSHIPYWYGSGLGWYFQKMVNPLSGVVLCGGAFYWIMRCSKKVLPLLVWITVFLLGMSFIPVRTDGSTWLFMPRQPRYLLSFLPAFTLLAGGWVERLWETLPDRAFRWSVGLTLGLLWVLPLRTEVSQVLEYSYVYRVAHRALDEAERRGWKLAIPSEIAERLPPQERFRLKGHHIVKSVKPDEATQGLPQGETWYLVALNTDQELWRRHEMVPIYDAGSVFNHRLIQWGLKKPTLIKGYLIKL